MPINEKLKNIFSFLLRAGLSIGLLAFIFSRIDAAKTRDVLQSASPGYLALALVIFFVVNFMTMFRWSVFIRALDLTVTASSIVRYYFIGLFGNLFLPSSIGGDLIKILGLCKEHPSRKLKVVASVLLDRLSGFVSIVIIAVCSFVFGYKHIGEPSLLIPIGVMAVGSLVLLVVLFDEGIYAFYCRIFNKFPKIKNGLMTMNNDIAMLKNRKAQWFKGIVISCVSQLTFILTFFLIAKALHQDIPFIYFLVFIPLIYVASSLPSIGGLGVREAGAAYLFAKVGVASSVAVSLSLMMFLFMVVIGLMGGVVYVFTLSAGRVQHCPPNAEIDPA